VEVISGLTAGIAGAASMGIAVTDRRHAPGVALVTGHARDGGAGPDWQALVRSRLTLVVYMGVSSIEEVAAALPAAGMAPEIPSAVISAAHTAAQRHAVGTLAELAGLVREQGLSSPAVLVIGSVAAAARAQVDELTRQALAG
jgi:uroporphyrin-III C-methyltransferase